MIDDDCFDVSISSGGKDTELNIFCYAKVNFLFYLKYLNVNNRTFNSQLILKVSCVSINKAKLRLCERVTDLVGFRKRSNRLGSTQNGAPGQNSLSR